MGCECSVAANTHKSKRRGGRASNRKGASDGGFDAIPNGKGNRNTGGTKKKKGKKGAKKEGGFSEVNEIRAVKSALRSPVPETALEKEHPLGEGDVSVSASFKEPRRVSFHDEKKVTNNSSGGSGGSGAAPPNPLQPAGARNKETTSDTTGSSGRQLTSQLGLGDPAEISGVPSSVVNSSQNSGSSIRQKVVHVKNKKHGPLSIPKAKCGPSKVRVVRQWIDGSVLGDDSYEALDGPLLDPQEVAAQVRREKKIEFREQAARTQQQVADQEELEKAKQMVASVQQIRAQKDAKAEDDGNELTSSLRNGSNLPLPAPTKLEPLSLSRRKSSNFGGRRSTKVLNYLELPSEGAMGHALQFNQEDEEEPGLDAQSEQQTDVAIPPSVHEEENMLKNIPSSSEEMSSAKADRSRENIDVVL